jgi:hypothetical protein
MKTTLFIFSIAILSTCASAQEEVFGRPQQPEDRVSLDGHWEMFLTNDPAVTPPHPPEGKAVAVALEGIKNARGPNGWSGLDEPYLHAWYSRKILIPESWDGRRVFVSFLPCLWEARVFLNGQPVGVNTGMLPFTLDITAAAKPGADNDLLVIASGEVALLLDREKDLALLTPTEREEFKKIVPNGHYSSRLGGRWKWKVLNAYGMRLGLQGGELWSDNPVYVADAFVKTSFREKLLAVEVTVRNHLPQKADVVVSAHVLDKDGKIVLKLSGKNETLASGGEVGVRLESPWSEPHLWETDDPYLYTLVCEVADQDKVLTAHRTRFGFREFWSDKDQFILNGKRLHLRGDALMYPNANPEATIRDLRVKGLNAVRICWSDQPTQATMDVFDANGIIVSMEPGLHSEMGSLNLARQDSRFWDFFRNDMETMIRQYRNHPAIYSWCFANEYRFRGESSANIAKVAALKEHLQSNFDPTRFYWAADDYTLDFFDLSSIHGAPHSEFPNPGSIGSESAREMTLIPNGAYLWKTLPVINTATNPWIEFRMSSDKPIMLDENAYLFFRITSMDPLSLLFGDEAYSGSTLNAIEDSPVGSGFLHWQNIMAHRYRSTVGSIVFRANRMNSIAGFFPHGYDLRGGANDPRYQAYLPMYQEVMAEKTFFLHSFARNYYDDEKVVIDISVHNDTRQTRRLKLVWRLGNNPESEQDYELEPGMMKADVIVVSEGEAVAVRKSVPVAFRLLEDGKELKHLVHMIEVFPRATTTLLPGEKLFSVYDPPGALRHILDAANVDYHLVENIETLEDVRGALFIGSDALPDDRRAGLALVKYAETGGRVILLQQSETPAWLPVRLPPLDNTSHSTIAFPTAPLHPVLANLREEDFKFWRGDRDNMLDWNVVSLVNYIMPVAGNFLPIITAGGENGFFYSPLIEYPIGKGAILGCQLILTEKSGREPVADIVLRNLIQYATTPSGTTWATGGIIPGEDKDGVALLNHAGVILKPISDLASASQSVVFVHASAISAINDVVLKKLAEDGRILVVYGLSKIDSVTKLGNKLGLPLVADAMARADLPLSKVADWRNRELLQGVNDGMFFWTTSRRMQHSGTTDNESQNFFYDRSLADIVLVRAPGALIARGDRSVMASIAVGAGKVILSTLRWDKALAPDPTIRTQRLLSILATNLGVTVNATSNVPPIDPANTFQLDLRQFANMAFRDEVAEDGKGGWTDEGNANDMPGMPLGMQYFTERMIPFDIIDPALNNAKSVLLLGYDKNPLARTVTIPVGRKATRLFFLHTSAWSGENAMYTVRYEDGVTVDIPVANGVNITDWWSSTAAPGTALVPVMNAYQIYEKGLMANPTVIKSTRYLTCFTWGNPKTDSTIDSITMATEAKKTRFVLLAITGQIAADAPKAVRVFNQQDAFKIQNDTGLILTAGNYSLAFGTQKPPQLYHVNPYITIHGKEYYATNATEKLGVSGEVKDGTWQGTQRLEFDAGGTLVPLYITHAFSPDGDTVTVTCKQPVMITEQGVVITLKQVMYWDADGGKAAWETSDGQSGRFSPTHPFYGKELKAADNPENPSFIFSSENGDRIYLYAQPGTVYKFSLLNGKNPAQPPKSVVMYLFPPKNSSSAETDIPISWWYRIVGKSKAQGYMINAPSRARR